MKEFGDHVLIKKVFITIDDFDRGLWTDAWSCLTADISINLIKGGFQIDPIIVSSADPFVVRFEDVVNECIEDYEQQEHPEDIEYVKGLLLQAVEDLENAARKLRDALNG